MDSITEKNTPGPFPYDSLRRFRNFVTPDIEKKSLFSAQSYDNRGRVSDVASALRSKLGFFKTRLQSSSFLSGSFSWQVNTAAASEPDKLLAKAFAGAEKKTYSLEVDEVATSQNAAGTRLVSDDLTDLQEGTYTYDVTMGNKTHSVEVVIEKKGGVLPTNRSVLLDIERSINKLGLDMTATLNELKTRDYNPYRENAYKDVSFISISSNSTGKAGEFSIADTSGTLIETLNLDRVQQYGLQNKYRLDGRQSNSDSNDIVVDTGKVEAYLLGTTKAGENLQVSVEQSAGALASELTLIIDDYNQLIQWIDDNNYAISPSLKTVFFKELPSIALQSKTVKNYPLTTPSTFQTGFNTVVTVENKNTIDNDLAEIGLTLNNNGSLSVEENFTSSVSSDFKGVYDALAGSNGFFTKISQAIDSIHGKNEAGYVYSKNSILSYEPDGKSLQSVYKNSTSNIISFFA